MTGGFSERLKEAREKLGLTQQGLSERLEIPKRTIEKWETGDRVPPDYVQRLVLKEMDRE